MTKEQAEWMVKALGPGFVPVQLRRGKQGNAWNSGGGIYLVLLPKKDGRLVVLSDECVCEYVDEDAFSGGRVEKVVYFGEESNVDH